MSGLFGVSWKSIATGLASGVGFAVGGPIGAAVLGGATSMAMSRYVDHESWTQATEHGLIAGATGWIGGGLASGGLDGVADAFGNAAVSVGERIAGTVSTGEMRELALIASENRMGWGALAAGAATMAGYQATNSVFDNKKPAPPVAAPSPAIDHLPVTNIGHGDGTFDSSGTLELVKPHSGSLAPI